MNKKFKILFILFILICGFLLRVLGIGYGLPDISHPDETRVILDTFSMGHRGSLLPERPDYALLYRYFLLFIFGFYFLLGKILGVFKNSLDFASSFIINPANIYLIARTVSVIFGTAIGIGAYIFGKNVFKKEVIGISAMVFTLFEFQLLQHSQWSIYPIILCFFTLPAFYYMFKLIEEPARKNFLLSGMFCGLAISIQNQAIFLIPSLFLTYLLSFRTHKTKIKINEFIKLVIYSLFIFLLFCLMGNFYWFFVFNKSLAKTLELFGVTRVGFSSAAPYNYNFFSMFWWFINELIRQDGILGLVMVAGIIYSIYKHNSFDLIFLLFLFIYLWALSSWGFRIMHDMVSLLPIICIFASRFLIEITERVIRKNYYYVVISCLIVLPLAKDSLQADIKKLHKDTRQIARDWVEQNIPQGSRIAVDWPIFSVPLKSDIPFLFRNPVALKYYSTKLPEKLRHDYRGYLKSKKTYNLIDIIYCTEEPLWPKEMPDSVKQEAEKKYVYRDLYSRFNFKTLDDIKKENVRYIIITSYSWGFFLLDNDQNKRNLFNAFIKDRPEFNYHHVDYYVDDNRHGIIFYLAKHGREFYELLLNNKAKDIRLIKEFYPTDDNLGPTIKIFAIKRNE